MSTELLLLSSNRWCRSLWHDASSDVREETKSRSDVACIGGIAPENFLLPPPWLTTRKRIFCVRRELARVPEVQRTWNRGEVIAKRTPCVRVSWRTMAKESMSTELLDTRFLTGVWPYAVFIVLAVTSFQLLRLVLSIILTVFRQLVRIVLFVISWPVYLILLPARALVYFTRLTTKVMFYAALAAVLYKMVGGTLNFALIKDTFGEVLQNVQSTFLQQWRSSLIVTSSSFVLSNCGKFKVLLWEVSFECRWTVNIFSDGTFCNWRFYHIVNSFVMETSVIVKVRGCLGRSSRLILIFLTVGTDRNLCLGIKCNWKFGINYTDLPY